jgi:hypothetical protein
MLREYVAHGPPAVKALAQRKGPIREPTNGAAEAIR